MKYTDIAIIGGGLAGSTAAAMLGRAGIATLLIDPHEVYPFDFRVEKLSGDEQLDRFFRTGIADLVLRSATHDGETGTPCIWPSARQSARAANSASCTTPSSTRPVPKSAIPPNWSAAKVTEVSTKRGAAEIDAVRWPDDLGPAGGARQRA